jgi:hypothetical protein
MSTGKKRIKNRSFCFRLLAYSLIAYIFKTIPTFKTRRIRMHPHADVDENGNCYQKKQNLLHFLGVRGKSSTNYFEVNDFITSG